MGPGKEMSGTQGHRDSVCKFRTDAYRREIFE
jgi:hypothetical protein